MTRVSEWLYHGEDPPQTYSKESGGTAQVGQILKETRDSAYPFRGVSGRMKYVPPSNFSPVERRLYRSAEPLPISFPFLKLLGIETIIWLAVEDPSDALLDFVDEHDIQFEHLGLLTKGSKPWDPLSAAAINQALERILSLEKYPLLVCCGMGRHRTGTVVGCLRKLQGWSFASLVDEYQRFAGLRGERSSVELAIENFDLGPIVDVVKAKREARSPIPPWFNWHLENIASPR